jgi:hypothetical protein
VDKTRPEEPKHLVIIGEWLVIPFWQPKLGFDHNGKRQNESSSMQTRYLSSNSGPGDSRPGNSSVFTKYVGNLCRPTIGLAFAAILISSTQAHDHGGGGGGQ